MAAETPWRTLLARLRTTQDRLLIVYDETALPPGKLRLRPRGSAAGHNGIKSIISALGSQDFARLRIGVGQPPPGTDRVGWVLGEMSSEDQDLVDDAIDRASQAIISLMEDGIDSTMGTVQLGEVTQDPSAARTSRRSRKTTRTSVPLPSPGESIAGGRTPP